jgi:hypothetical protein
MNVHDPLSFLKEEEAELFIRRNHEKVSKSRRSWKIFGVRPIVWCPLATAVVALLAGIAIMQNVYSAHWWQGQDEKRAVVRLAERGVQVFDEKVIPDWECAPADDGRRVVAAWAREVATFKRETGSPNSALIDTSELSSRVWGTTTTEPPVPDAELLAAFPYLRSINGTVVAGEKSNDSAGANNDSRPF